MRGDETDGDTFIYVENIINEEKTVSEAVDSINALGHRRHNQDQRRDLHTQ